MFTSRGFSLIDVTVAMVIIALLSAISVPLYSDFVERGREARAITDVRSLDSAILRYWTVNSAYPDDLSELGGSSMQDPWGATYRYLRIDGSSLRGIRGKQRKDKNLNPLNSDFDLYSAGPDGKTKTPLTAKDSRDDIVRAGDGGFIGPARDH
jgi:general secretion pathway protein G